jgi:hypothetical protein
VLGQEQLVRGVGLGEVLQVALRLGDVLQRGGAAPEAVRLLELDERLREIAVRVEAQADLEVLLGLGQIVRVLRRGGRARKEQRQGEEARALQN